MKQFDERLQELQQKLSRRNQLESQRASLRKQLDELDLKVRMLRDAANREQYDVTELEGLSFASIWAKISGSYDEKLRQEKKEAFAAAAKYESAMKELEYITEEYHRLAEIFNPLYFNAEEWVKTAKDAGMTFATLPTSPWHWVACVLLLALGLALSLSLVIFSKKRGK